MFPNMLVFNAPRDLTATIYQLLVLCMKMFTRDHAYDHKDI